MASNLQNRLAAFQRASSTEAWQKEHSGRKASYEWELQKEASASSLKDRLSAYKGAAKPEPSVVEAARAAGQDAVDGAAPAPQAPVQTVEDKKEAFQPKRKNKLKDRMAAFERAPPPETEHEKQIREAREAKEVADRAAKAEAERKAKEPKSLKERMAALKEANSFKVDASRSIPKDLPQKKGGGIAARMSQYRQTAAPGAELDQFTIAKKVHQEAELAEEPEPEPEPPKPKAFKVKTPASSALQERMNAYLHAPETGGTPKSTYEISAEERGGDMNSRMSAWSYAPPPGSEPVKDGDADETRADGEKEESPEEPEAPKPKPVKKKKAGNDLSKRMDAYLSAPSEAEIPKSIPALSPEERGGDLSKRVSALKEATAPDAFEKNREKGHPDDIPERSPSGGGGDIKERLSAFKEVSSPDAFQKKKLEGGGASPVAKKSTGDLKQRMDAFKEVSAADAFLKKQLEEGGTSPVGKQSSGDLAKRMDAFKEVSSPDAFHKKKLEQPMSESEPEASPRMNPQDDKRLWGPDGKPYMGQVIENKVYAAREGPKDMDYLWELSVNLEQMKSQEYDSPHFKDILAQEGVDKKDKADKGDMKTKLEGLFAGKTSYTGDAKWLNKEWIDDHLIKDGEHQSITFRFRDHMLFTTFDKTNEKKRDNIINTFVAQLLKHANEITQLDLSSCLLPDKFVEVLAEEVLKNPASSLPKLQLLNLESNLLQGSGLEALGKVFGDPTAWKFLQVILLENQKNSMTSEAEKALADGVSQSSSVVVCSVSIRCPFQMKEITDALLYNHDQLRIARRDHQEKEGTLKERKRNDMEVFFDKIAANASDITEVEIVGDRTFLSMYEEEKVHAGATFCTNTTVKSVKMSLLSLDDNFAEAFAEALSVNHTIETVNIDSNTITGSGMKTIFAGLGQNSTIVEFQVRHQKKPMATVDEEELPDLLESNTTILKLGVDVRNQLVRMKLDRIIGRNADRVRKLRVAKSQSP